MARTAAEIREAITAIELRLDTATSKVTVDSTTTETDLAVLERRLTTLRRELESVDGTTKARRPVASRIDLGGF